MNAIVEVDTAEFGVQTAEAVTVTYIVHISEAITFKVVASTKAVQVASIGGNSISAVAPDNTIQERTLALA